VAFGLSQRQKGTPLVNTRGGLRGKSWRYSLLSFPKRKQANKERKGAPLFFVVKKNSGPQKKNRQKIFQIRKNFLEGLTNKKRNENMKKI